MSDDLDQFFAKKEKRRGKKGFAKANTQILAKKIEESRAKDLKQLEEEAASNEKLVLATSEATRNSLAQKSRLNQESLTVEEFSNERQNKNGKSTDVDGVTSSNNAKAASVDDDDGWIVVEEKETDLADLKIGEMTMDDVHSSPEQSDNDDKGNESSDEDDVDDKKVKKSTRKGASPWEIVENESIDIQAQQKNEKTTPAPSNVDSGSVIKRSTYVPPHLKGAATAERPMHRPGFGSRRHAPDISNEFMFPSLGNDVKESDDKMTSRNEHAEFVEVSGTKSSSQPSQNTESQRGVTLDNKFAALGH